MEENVISNEKWKKEENKLEISREMKISGTQSNLHNWLIVLSGNGDELWWAESMWASQPRNELFPIAKKNWGLFIENDWSVASMTRLTCDGWRKTHFASKLKHSIISISHNCWKLQTIGVDWPSSINQKHERPTWIFRKNHAKNIILFNELRDYKLECESGDLVRFIHEVSSFIGSNQHHLEQKNEKNTFSSFRVSFINFFFSMKIARNFSSNEYWKQMIILLLSEKNYGRKNDEIITKAIQFTLEKKKSSNLPSSSGRLLASPMKWMKIEISFTKKYFLQPQKTYEHFFMNEIQDFTALIPRRMCVGESTRVFFPLLIFESLFL